MRIWLLACLAVAIAVATARAQPDPLDDPATVHPLVAKARELAANNKLAEARAAYEAALVQVPDDPLALAELGWIEYRAKDLKAAEATTRRAIAHAVTADVRGAASYNLGRMREDAGDKAGAIASYSDSLRARRSSRIRAHLATLDAAAAIAFDRFAVQRLIGPFPSIEAFYKTVAVAPNAAFPTVCDIQVLGTADPKQLARPFEALELTHRNCDDLTMHVAVKLAAGWFFHAIEPTEIAVSPVASALHCGTVPVSLVDVAMPALRRGLVQVRVTYTTEGRCNHKNIDFGWNEQSVVAIGVGTSGLPSATPPITKHLIESDDLQSCMDGPCRPGKGTVTELDLQLAWKPEGTRLVIEGRKTRGLGDELRSDLVGAHTLVFP